MPITINGGSLEALVRRRSHIHRGAQWRAGRSKRPSGWMPLTHGRRGFNPRAWRRDATGQRLDARFYAYEAAERRAMYQAKPSAWCQALIFEVVPPTEWGPHPNPLGDGMLGAPFHQLWDGLEGVESQEAS